MKGNSKAKLQAEEEARGAVTRRSFIWVWVKIKPPGDSMFPFTRVSFWVHIFDPQPFDVSSPAKYSWVRANGARSPNFGLAILFAMLIANNPLRKSSFGSPPAQFGSLSLSMTKALGSKLR